MLNIYKYHKKPKQLNSPELSVSNAPFLFMYAREILKKRWPEAEPYVMQDPRISVYYAEYILKDRWKAIGMPEAEDVIMKDASHAVAYAKDVIHGEWPEAEPYIMKDPSKAYDYIRGIRDRRWPEAEQYIKTMPPLWARYKEIYGVEE